MESFLQVGGSKQKSGANELHYKMQLIDPTWSFIDAISSMVFHIELLAPKVFLMHA
jgi:hypothetical protein